MKIEIQIDEGCAETKIIIVTDRMTDEIADLMQRLSDETQQGIVGYSGGCAKLLEPSEIVRVYASGGKVYAESEQSEYVLRLRLYEVEEKLNKKLFMRISNSEIIHIKKAKKFDLSLAGTIRVSLSNGKAAYVSRRYVAKIKQALGL